MKTSLALLAGCCLLAFCGPTFAQDNRIGLFSDAAATINQVDGASGQLNLYMVALNPTDGGRPLATIRGFEARITFKSLADFVLAANFPVNVINVGSLDNLIVGYGEPLPVSGSAAVIATVAVYTAGQPESNIFLGPSDPPSMAGYMTLLDGEFNLVFMEPASGDPGVPVFYVNSSGPPLESLSWGTAKSLFR
jgi:hypothetical protein